MGKREKFGYLRPWVGECHPGLSFGPKVGLVSSLAWWVDFVYILGTWHINCISSRSFGFDMDVQYFTYE